MLKSGVHAFFMQHENKQILTSPTTFKYMNKIAREFVFKVSKCCNFRVRIFFWGTYIHPVVLYTSTIYYYYNVVEIQKNRPKRNYISRGDGRKSRWLLCADDVRR